MVASFSVLLLFFCALSSPFLATQGQEDPAGLVYTQPNEKWAMQSGGRVRSEVRVTPDGKRVLVLGNNCRVTAFDSDDGAEAWTFIPTNTSDCMTTGLLFGTSPTGVDYVAVPVAAQNGDDTLIVALDVDTGMEVFSIGPLIGKVAGSAVRSMDNQFIFATHNDVVGNSTIGYFTVWNIEQSSLIYFFDIEGSPFGPLGYYWNPVQGYFDGGYGNTNDVFIWSLEGEPSATRSGGGRLFAFQFPAPESDSGLRVTTLGNIRQFTSPFAPVITSEGLSMYMAISRNDIRCWDGERDLRRFAFHTGGNGRVDFPRNEGAISAPPPAPPSVSETTGMVYGPTGTSQIYRLNANCSQNVTIPTVQTVTSKVLVGPKFVYYVTTDPNATLFQLDPDTLETVWMHPLDRGVAANMDISPDGRTVFLADTAGLVRAIAVAEPAPPTVVTLTPTKAPTMLPTTSLAPSGSPTLTPGPTVSAQPTAVQSESPSSSPLPAPSNQPISLVTPDGVSGVERNCGFMVALGVSILLAHFL